MHWLWTRIQVRIDTTVKLDADIEEARQTLAQTGDRHLEGSCCRR